MRHGLVPGQRVELRGRDAQAEQRRRLIDQPAHEALVKHRRQFALEHGALCILGGGGKDRGQVDAVEPGQKVRDADEIPQQPALVDALAEPPMRRRPIRSRPSQ